MQKPEIYVSYAWRDREKDLHPDDRESIVDEFCKACDDREYPYPYVRDKTSLGYREDIQAFMRKIGAADYVFVVISDKYLRSEYCMFEAVRILAREQFEERVFPVVLADANVFDPKKSLDYKIFWKQELADLSKKLDDAGRDSAAAELLLKERIYKEIHEYIGDFITRISRLNVMTPEEHLKNRFSSIFAAIEKRQSALSEMNSSRPVPASPTSKSTFSQDLIEKTIPSLFEGHRQRIDIFFKNPQQRVLLITGPNESGKSHLLRDIVREADEIQKWACFVVEPHAFETYRTAPVNDKNTLLYCLDDADWKDEIVLKNVFQFIHNHPNTRLILTAHTSWKDKIDGAANGLKGFPGLMEHIELRPWEKEHLLQLFRAAAEKEQVEYEDDIVRQFPNPYLLKYFGEASTGKAQVDVAGISRSFSQKMHRVAEQALQPFLNHELAHSLLLFLVFHQPQNYQLAEIATQFDLDEQGIQAVFEQLQDVGLVRRRRGTWHLYPDVKADFYLASRLEGFKSKNVETLIAPYLKGNVKEVFARVVAASRYLSDSALQSVGEVLANTMNFWREELRQGSLQLNFRQIEAATEALSLEQDHGVETATDAACALVREALVKQAPSEREKEVPLHQVVFSSQPSADTYGRFLEKLAPNHRKRKDYLLLVQALWQTGWKSGASNYQPQSLLVNAFKPAYNTVATYQEGLKYARFWLLESNDPQLQEMGGAALQTSLGGFFEQTSHEYMKLVISTIGLPADKKLYAIRKEALQIVREGMERESLQLDCLHIISEIGFGDRLGDFRDIFKLPAYPQIQVEIESMIPLVGDRLLTSQDFLVQKTAEEILLRWWLIGISDNPEPYLLRFERSPEYLLYSYVTKQMYIVEDFAVWKAEAPQDNRWEWYESEDLHRSKRRKLESGYFNPLVKQLSERYAGAEKTARFINETVSQMEGWLRREGQDVSHSYYILGSIAATWADEQPDTFKEIRRDEALSSLLPEHIRAVVGDYLAQKGHYTVQEIAEPLLAKIPHLTNIEMRQLVFLIQQHQPDEKEDWLLKIIQEGTEPTLHEVAMRLRFFFKSDTETDKVAEYLLHILATGKITREDFFGGTSSDGAYFAYQKLNEQRTKLSPDLDEKLRAVTFEWVKRISNLEEGESQALHFCIRTADHLIDLIDYRAANWDIKTAIEKVDFRVAYVLPRNPFTQEELLALFQSADSHRRFVDKIPSWERAAVAFSFDWKGAYLSLNDPETGMLWVEKHLRDALVEPNLEKAAEYSQYIPSQEDYIPLLLDTWQKILPSQSDDEMKGLIFHWLKPPRTGAMLVPADYDTNQPAKVLLSKLTEKSIANIRLSAVISRLSEELKARWKKEEREDW